MLRKFLLVLTSLLILNFGYLGAQEEPPEGSPFTPQASMNQRSLGDQSFGISAGLIIPLFTVLLNDYPDAGFSSGVYDTRLSLGGMGQLAWSLYLSPNIKVGLQLGGTFQWDDNRNLLYMIPITAKGSYEFHPLDRLTIPIHLALGINMTSWNDFFQVNFLVRPGFGVYFDWNVEWSFGIDFTYWFVPQLNVPTDGQKALANMMDITVGAEYHF